ncbi:baseplate J/gp47 family protein [Limosilactobacillus sp. STM2_1]|uniref:Baseplate J/gp47 family protein n=1 Tax=Limosilactobacillus rudii TaxID=2759755 RepID=A0A7W3YN58_9LACO|nr:baseplate J/gp47 family protein [Limosilactobacillus rudii]MBB1078975.1 baseplate J/gp47 family protein [Limosilactobacillus rudii]MBB1097156.1 baseplate J/gp47 family protein [Limosilactobacillus rudii]MCD7134149.1 baseplate J/gp47 family protein [Limosilactobacillus rudii]
MLDKNGFTRPTYDEIVQQESDKWVQLFGENAQTNAHSVGGILIRIHSYFMDKLYQLAEVIYNSQFVDSATGTTLEQLGANVGLTRLPSQVAMGTVTFYGKIGYTVPSGSLVRTDDGLEYVTSEDIVLKDTGKNNMTLDDGSNLQMPTESNGTCPNIGVGISHYLYANKAGAAYNKANKSKAIMVNASENIRYVIVQEVSGGADIETDINFRDRINLSNRTVAPSSPYNGIITAVEKVTGVTAVRIISNDTMVDDETTNTPAKSIHIYVNGGYKDDVAEAIFGSISAGILTVGQQSVKVTDIAGGEHTICFDYPTTRDVYVSIKLTKTNEYPLNGDEQVKNIVMKYINEVGMGNTLYYSYLYRLIYDNVPGIQVADVKIGTDSNKLSAQNITLTNIETAQTSAEKVMIL